MQRGRYTEQHAGGDGNGCGEQQHNPIDPDGRLAREIIGRQPVRDQLYQSEGQHNAAFGADERKRQGFAEQQSHDPRPPCAHRGPHRQLLSARCAARQQQNGNIGAADQQHQRHAGE